MVNSNNNLTSRRTNMKKAYFLTLAILLLVGSTAKAQFNKPLLSSNNRSYSTEAKYNVGIIGGATMTYWLHFGGTKTPYRTPFNFGLTGGIVVERMLNKSTSVSLEGLYAMRNTQLNYEVLNFPVALNQSKDFYRQLNADYQEVNVQIPLTYYFGQANSNIRPYVFAAPRATIPLGGKMIWQKKEILNSGTDSQQYIDSSVDTVEMNAQNSRQWNVGLVVGAGVRFKINIGNYYLIAKADLSGHAAVINSFTSEEIHGESQNVIGAGYIDPYLLGMRFNTDATARITILFPLKKQLKGACMRWGEYD